MMLRILPFLMLPLLGIGQTNSKVEKPVVGNTTSEKQPLEIKRNAQYNLDEIKVRWKKAALENCTGFPCIVAPSFTCGTSTVSDIDNNVYNTVSIGTQCWIKENLKVTKYNDGTVIPDETANTAGWGGLATGARTDYTGATGIPSGQTYVSTYGYLYNWYAVNDLRKLCPAGWHVPADSDWNKLVKSIDSGADTSAFSTIQSTTAGGKLKSSTLWNAFSSPGTNDFGFSALPGGYRDGGGSFNVIRNNAYFFSATQSGPTVAITRGLNFNNGNVERYSGISKSLGESVRCLKD